MEKRRIEKYLLQTKSELVKESLRHTYRFVDNEPIGHQDYLGLIGSHPLPGDPISMGYCVYQAFKKFYELQKMGQFNDRYLHCVMGCELTKSCGFTVSQITAFLYEVYQEAVGPGGEFGDMVATQVGGALYYIPVSCECSCEKLFRP